MHFRREQKGGSSKEGFDKKVQHHLVPTSLLSAGIPFACSSIFLWLLCALLCTLRLFPTVLASLLTPFQRNTPASFRALLSILLCRLILGEVVAGLWIPECRIFCFCPLHSWLGKIGTFGGFEHTTSPVRCLVYFSAFGFCQLALLPLHHLGR